MYTKLKNYLSQIANIGRGNSKAHERECKKFALLGDYCDKRSRDLVEFFKRLTEMDAYRLNATSSSSDLEKLNSAIELCTLLKDVDQWGKILKFVSDKSELEAINDKINAEGFEKYFWKTEGDKRFSPSVYKERLKASPDGYAIWESADNASDSYLRAENRKTSRTRFIAPIVFAILGAIGGALLAFPPLSPFDIDTELPARLIVAAGLAGIGYGLGALFEKLDRKIAKKYKNAAWKKYDKAIQRLKEQDELSLKTAKAACIERLNLPQEMPPLPTFNKYLLPVLELFCKVSDEAISLRSLNGLGEYSIDQLRAVREYLKNGRADTIKEGLNLYLTDQKIALGFQLLQKQQDELRKRLLAERQALLGTLSAFVKAESRKTDAIIENQQNLQQTLNEIKAEEEHRTDIIEKSIKR
ncbi:MAG: hypothetical protein IJ308_03865 [Clostridia bacterium]|nr:hypothetical protein [Clostridia bacterium]